MNKLNTALLLLIVLLISCGFWPNSLSSIIRWVINRDLLIQALVVGIGVFGGMWADKQIQKHEAIRRLVGALETIDAELQSNIKIASDIKEAINTRPSYERRSEITSLEKVIEMIRSEEQWVSEISKQIVDKGYYVVLSTISTIDKRKIFERIVNSYLKLRNTKFTLGLLVMKDFTKVENYSDEQKKEVINIGDQHFNKLSEGLAKMIENLTDTDNDVIAEERRLLNRIKRV